MGKNKQNIDMVGTDTKIVKMSREWDLGVINFDTVLTLQSDTLF